MNGTTTIDVVGMTCGHCVSAVTEELERLLGVTEVTVTLVPGGSSSVTVVSDCHLAPGDLAAAVDEAGYAMAEAGDGGR
jgi:copper chaperone CopZ